MRVGRLSDGVDARVAVARDGAWYAVSDRATSALDVLDCDGASLLLDAEPLPERFRPTVPFKPARNVMCLGKNFRAHATEFAAYAAEKETVPEHPIVFTKTPEALCGAEDAIEVMRDVAGSLDYEVELGVVIGRDGTAIPAAEAQSHVAGYTVVNDVTARDAQERHRQWFLGKSLPGATPIGPALVSADEVGDLADVLITCHVNGELRQSARLGDMIFGVAETIALISELVPLQRGDILSLGTPSGVGIGFTPPRFLADGDTVACAIEGVGELRNTVRFVDSGRSR